MFGTLVLSVNIPTTAASLAGLRVTLIWQFPPVAIELLTCSPLSAQRQV